MPSNVQSNSRVTRNSASDAPVTASDIKTLLDSLKQHFDSKLVNVETKLSAIHDSIKETNESLSNLKSVVARLEKRVSNLENVVDSMERNIKLNDVLLYGIPQIAGENTKEILTKLSAVIGCVINSETVSFRSIKRNESIASDNCSQRKHSKTKSSPIIVKFFSSVEKITFIKALRKHKPKIAQLGFVGNSYVFVRESLSSFNMRIFQECMQLKRNGALSSVFTMRGFVYIRRTVDESATPTKVSSLDQLASISGIST